MKNQLNTMDLSVLTVKELAKVLRIGINAAYTLVQNGTIFSVKVGRQYRIPRHAVDEFLQRQAKETA